MQAPHASPQASTRSPSCLCLLAVSRSEAEKNPSLGTIASVNNVGDHHSVCEALLLCMDDRFETL